MTPPLDAQRFLDAQDDHGTYDAALDELAAGCKKSHWMWFVFPQLAGLGESERAVRYSIGSLDDASEYLGHRILGARLRRAADVVRSVEHRSAREILGELDASKLRSSMTLFTLASRGADGADDDPDAVFDAVLARFFAGELDERTLQLLADER